MGQRMTLDRCHTLVAQSGALALAAIALLVLDNVVFAIAVDTAGAR